MKKKHVNIPIFIPELACPHQCIFCNQKQISGQSKIPSIQEVRLKIDTYLKTLDLDKTEIELAFFGGNFTGLPLADQKKYLTAVKPYLDQKKIQSIRVSTRPDSINPSILEMLYSHSVRTIELGAQSFDPNVLHESGRGHTPEDIVLASNQIKSFGFKLGLQMMVGLPGDSLEKSLFTVKKIIALKADFVRIYPTLVIRGTELEKLFHTNRYAPLSLAAAVSQCKEIYLRLEQQNIPVIRLGLHPSENLIQKTSLLAGPFHVSFKELVLTEIWKDCLLESIKNYFHLKKILLFVAPEYYNHAVGYQAENKKLLEKYFTKVLFKPEAGLKKYEIKITGF